jgi:hypothetical protein
MIWVWRSRCCFDTSLQVGWLPCSRWGWVLVELLGWLETRSSIPAQVLRERESERDLRPAASLLLSSSCRQWRCSGSNFVVVVVPLFVLASGLLLLLPQPPNKCWASHDHTCWIIDVHLRRCWSNFAQVFLHLPERQQQASNGRV